MVNAKYFTQKELECPCGECSFKFSPITLRRLDALREELGEPVIINSGYRCHAYNKEKGYTQTHATGHAVDIKASGKHAVRLLELAIKHGFTGIGVNQKGVYSGRFIHLDDLNQLPNRPRAHIWSY